MNKSELLAAMAAKSGLNRADAEKALTAFWDVVGETLGQGDQVHMTGFGSFGVSERAGRTGRNPQTGETLQIAASKAPKFKAGKALKDAMNGYPPVEHHPLRKITGLWSATLLCWFASNVRASGDYDESIFVVPFCVDL